MSGESGLPLTSKRCGTYSGWAKHKKDKTQVCQPCRIAFNAYQNAYRKKERLILIKVRNLVKELA